MLDQNTREHVDELNTIANVDAEIRYKDALSLFHCFAGVILGLVLKSHRNVKRNADKITAEIILHLSTWPIIIYPSMTIPRRAIEILLK